MTQEERIAAAVAAALAATSETGEENTLQEVEIETTSQESLQVSSKSGC